MLLVDNLELKMKDNRFEGTYATKSDIGRVRIANEDEVLALKNSNKDILLAVADGMGGHRKGDYASKKTVEMLEEAFNKKEKFFSIIDARFWLIKTIKKINKTIFDIQDKNEAYKGMGTTLCLVLIYKNKILVLNAGDSRCYILKKEILYQVTEDQTYVNYLLKSGQITKKEALTHPKRHHLINAIGLFPSSAFDLDLYKYEGESIFICSDGLYNNVSFKDIETNLNTTNSPSEKVESLINLGNYNGGSDNISCVLWECYK